MPARVKLIPLSAMISRTLILLVSCAATLAWDVKDHQVLDVVEEIGFENNFYVFMGISPGASIQDIKKAYRKYGSCQVGVVVVVVVVAVVVVVVVEVVVAVVVAAASC